jgi:hypothetical protein
VGKRTIPVNEFRVYIQKAINILEKGSTREEILSYLKDTLDRYDNDQEENFGGFANNRAHNHTDLGAMLMQIQQVLNRYGFSNELRKDRRDGPYINMGDVRRVRMRAQFWYQESSRKVHFWAGNEMGFWYNQSVDSKYRVSWKANSDKETKLSFPDVSTAIEYIKEVAEKYGRL